MLVKPISGLPKIPSQIINSIIDIELTIKIMKTLLLEGWSELSKLKQLSDERTFNKTMHILLLINYIKYSSLGTGASLTNSGLRASIRAESLELLLNNQITLSNGKSILNGLTDYKTLKDYYISDISLRILC